VDSRDRSILAAGVVDDLGALWRQYGNADAVVDVYPGRVVELEYKAPTFAGFTSGSLGYLPQRQIS
jgi:hypothetical protein